MLSPGLSLSRVSCTTYLSVASRFSDPGLDRLQSVLSRTQLVHGQLTLVTLPKEQYVFFGDCDVVVDLFEYQ